MRTSSLFALGLFIVVPIVAFGPLAAIWALNTLFHLGIPLTLTTWAAVLVLWSLITVGGSR